MKLDKNYDPSKYEEEIYQKWLDHNSFKATNNYSKYFSIVLPPPNANANLHLGQSLTVAIEDISTRFNRMKGRDTLFVPGADHAGFETWVVYEKKLNQQGRTRFDFTNKELYDQVWDFVEDNKNNMLSQLKRMGISADWNKFTYTLDKKVVDQAYKTFKKMWDEKLIYRGERIVNYCTFHGTSFSDIEVVYKNQKGKLWYLKYPIKGSSEFITVATTRPETMLGDTAIAVNPKDKRFTKLVGKTVILPMQNKEIPVVADSMVESDFGTGAVKITPAHDQNDFELAQRNDLPMVSVINTTGEMFGDIPKKYQGLRVDEAREEIITDLQTLGLVERVEDYANRVGHCYKCHTIIQPLLSKQWFVSMKPLAQQAIKKLEDDQIKFYPESKLNQSIEYLKNIRDWNISRQIPWGIPIPAWQNKADSDDWIYDERVDQDEITIGGKNYQRDPDVFDTWFSSGQWPYITLGYPDNLEFKKFYPLTLMETGGEILYQWVCRMIMLGVYVTGVVPFKNVYIHGYVMAEDGSKMSKSVGNVVDPMPLIDKYGSDAVRIGLIISRSAGINSGFDPRKIEEGRNFANKLWNLARFIETRVESDFKYSDNPKLSTLQDEWILNRLEKAINQITSLLEDYRFSETFDNIYHFVWDDFADWYIEASKTETNVEVLCYVFNNILKLVHPYAPFVSEVIWQNFSWNKDGYLVVSKWPEIKLKKKNTNDDFNSLISLVEEIRFIKATLGNQIKISLLTDNKLINSHEKLIKNLAKVNSIKNSKIGQGLKLQSIDRVWVDVSDSEIKNFVSSLKKQKTILEVNIKNLESRLKNKSYLDKAPKSLIEESRINLDTARTSIKSLDKQIKNFII
jgi:valyl-tRNA synthetase